MDARTGRGEGTRWSEPFERELFRDRQDAGRQLAAELRAERAPDLLVLGIPRGGVPVADEVARALGAELDIVVARKVGAPDNPELALGAVTPDGRRFMNDELVRWLEVDAGWLEREVARRVAEARERERKFRAGRPAPRLEGRHVVLVDDGLATGATASVCARALRAQGVARLVLAVPVGSREACERLSREVDRIVCPWRPADFSAVGLHYENFGQVADDEVIELLAARAQEFAPRRG